MIQFLACLHNTIRNSMENLQGSGRQNTSEPVDKEIIPVANQIVVATNCLYREYRVLSNGEQRNAADTDGIRGDLALEFFRKNTASGIRTVVCDGGSSSQFLTALDKFNNHGLTIVQSQTPGRGPQRRQAFEVAIALPDSKTILYTQAEKTSREIPQDDYLAEISRPILAGDADIVIPKRNPKLGRESYPPYMWLSELNVNKTYDFIMKKAGLMEKDESFDWFFGQVVFKNDPEINALFLKKYAVDGSIRSRIGATPNPEMHSDGHYFPVIEALFNKKRVVSIEVPFVYPPEQKANEMSPEKRKDFEKRRIADGAAYRLEAIHFLAFLRGNPKSMIREVTSNL